MPPPDASTRLAARRAQLALLDTTLICACERAAARGRHARVATTDPARWNRSTWRRYLAEARARAARSLWPGAAGDDARASSCADLSMTSILVMRLPWQPSCSSEPWDASSEGSHFGECPYGQAAKACSGTSCRPHRGGSRANSGGGCRPERPAAPVSLTWEGG